MSKFKVGDKVTSRKLGCNRFGELGVVINADGRGEWYDVEWDSELGKLNLVERDEINLYVAETEKVAVVPPHGGPSKYYDFPFSEWVTSNDQMEYFATNKWSQYSLHLKDVFKACCRWGDKEGTSLEYDARKIVYSGLRLLMMIKGKKVVQEYLKELVEDQQFKG
jgi:hypothetical protein